MQPGRTPLIAGNWKLNLGDAAGIELAVAVARTTAHLPGVEVVIAPPFTLLAAVARECAEVARQLRATPIGIAAQNLHFEPSGAFTGEVSAPMLRFAGCSSVIIGHSERRQYFGEQDQFVARKSRAALDAGLCPIVCVGETLEQRSAGRTLDVVLGQLEAVLPALGAASGTAVVAYEPVWAIGTGKVATPTDAEGVHAAIRERLARHAPELARLTRILYGGSVKADNASALLSQPNIDGALVGGASLEISEFDRIVRATHALVGA
jgi:triosephosphate isomerase (TIM)